MPYNPLPTQGQNYSLALALLRVSGGVRKDNFMDTQTLPIVNDESERKESTVKNTPAIFKIRDNPKAVGIAPLIELDSQSEVVRWCGLIFQSAQRYGVDPRLAMTIMYMETTHG